MPIVKLKQVISAILLSVVFIWLLRLGAGDKSDASVERDLEPLALSAVKQRKAWEAKELRERLLIFVPEKKKPTALDKEAAERAAQLAAQQAAEAAAKAVDKTIKPMFSQLDDDHQVGLIAVIESDRKQYAVVQKINFATKQNQNIKLRHAETFDGWTISIQSQTRVVLNKSERQIYLNLFKPGNI